MFLCCFLNYVLKTKKNLENQGFHCFLPVFDKSVRHARRFREVTAPVFPRYLFVTLDPACQPWRRINGTPGVTSLIMAGEKPLSVRQGVVETLLASSTASGRLQFTNELALGESVRLVAGPFAEALGVIAGLDASGRVDVLLQMMGGVRVTLARTWVQPAA